MRAPRITMYIGLPGSGKSTHRAKLLAENPNTLVLSSDDVVEAFAKNNAVTYTQALALTDSATIHKLLYMLLEEAVKENRDILVDQTNTSEKRRHKFLCRVPAHYQRVAVVFPVHRLVLARRLALREKESGKVVPWYVVERMRQHYDPPSDKLPEALVAPIFRKDRPEFGRVETIRGERPGVLELLRGIPHELVRWWNGRSPARVHRVQRLP